MSGHGLQWRMRRSSSFSSQGRPSVGIGAQRVPAGGPGATVDSRVRSSGGLKPFGSTVKRSSSFSALNQLSSSKQSRTRVSGGGSSCLKDTRPFGDRVYRERMVRELVEFLMCNRYPHQVNLKGANGPSTGDFRKVFEFLVNQIQPDFKLGSKLDDDVVRTLKGQCYPFTITKSHLSTIGVQHTWPPILAALSYLRTCIQTVQSLDVDQLVFGVCDDAMVDRKRQTAVMYFQYVEKAYAAFIGDRDDECDRLRVDFERKLDNEDVQHTDIEELATELARNEERLRELESQPNELLMVQNDTETLGLDCEKLERYVNGLTKYVEDAQKELDQLVTEHDEQVKISNSLSRDIHEKTQLVSSQRVSGFDAQRINSQRTELRTQRSQAEKELQEIDSKLLAEEALLRQEKASLSASIAEYNRVAQLLQLIPSTAANADGFDYELRPDITQAESSRYETVVQPAVYVASHRQAEKCRQVEEDVNRMRGTLEHLCELIAERNAECTHLSSSISAVSQKRDTAKDVSSEEMQRLLCRVDELNEIISSRHAQSTLDSSQQLLVVEQECFAKKKGFWQERENLFAQHVLDVAEIIIEYKSNMKENLPIACSKLREKFPRK